MTEPNAERASDQVTNAVDYDRMFSQLCHLIALNLTDKVEGAIERLVLTTLVVDPATVHFSASTLDSAVFVLYGARVSEEALERAIDHLLEDGRVLRDTDRQLRPSLEAAASVAARIEQVRNLEASVKAEWLGEITGLVPDPGLNEPLWAALQRYLALAFRRHGAETAQLLDPSTASQVPEGTLSAYLEQAIHTAGLAGHKALAREAIDRFFHSPTAARISYLAQLLDGTFTFFALALDDATADYLKESLAPLVVFLDTNYIFGLLDLHENFFVRASKELVRFIRDNDLPFRLYYHEYTYLEIERTLSAQADRLRTRRWQSALSRAAVDSDALMGLERLYHRANAQAPTDVDAFLSRYDNVTLLLQPLGLDIYREGSGPPFTLREKSELIADYQDFIDKATPTSRSHPKRSYSALDHDASVWLAMRRLRVKRGSVLDSGALFLTNDYWFYRFDKGLKPGAYYSTPGGVVLPTHLLQLLRPLVPATDDFDRRFVETFALPEFRAAQSGYSATASKVLAYLATYKDIPAETAVAILRNEALSARLRVLHEDSPEFRDAIDSEVIEINRMLLEEKVQLEQELKAAALKPADHAVGAGVGPRESADLRAVAERAEKRLRLALAAIAILAFALGEMVIFIVPGAIGWVGLETHPHVLGLKVAATALWLGVCWAVATRDGRIALVATVIACILAFSQLV